MKQGFENVKTPLPTGCENRRGKPLIFLFSTDFPVLFFQSGKLKNTSILFPGLFGCSSNEICKLPLIFKILFPVFFTEEFHKKTEKRLVSQGKNSVFTLSTASTTTTNNIYNRIYPSLSLREKERGRFNERRVQARFERN